MTINSYIFLASSPFYDAYFQSDFLGKIIFISLLILSIISWVVIVNKILFNFQARKNSIDFSTAFQSVKANPLVFDYEKVIKNERPNPFLALYLTLKKQTVDILNKNRRFGQQNPDCLNEHGVSYLSPSDINVVESHLLTTMASQTKKLEKNLYILSTIVSLAPFLGLLGTVWGILTTFSALQSQTMGSTHQMVLNGLSLALATTVLGLIDAIPALIGYNYLKNSIRDFEIEMEGFSNEILALVEMQYRKVDVR